MKNKLDLLGVHDDPNTGYCCNIYIDNTSGSTYVERVWDNQGVTVIANDGSVSEMSLDDFELLESRAGDSKIKGK